MQTVPNNSISRLVPLTRILLSNEKCEKTRLFEEFDKCGNVSGIGNLKWETVPVKNKDKKSIYPLWIADMDFPVPAFLQRAFQNRLAFPNYGYTQTSDEYYQAIIQWLYTGHGFLCQKSDIFRCSAKSLLGLGLVIQALSEPGDRVILMTPMYHAFFNLIASNERKMIESPLIYRDRTFYIDFEDLEEKIRKNRPKMLLFCNPQNPIARVWKKSEIERVQEICLRFEVVMVSDEVFGDLVFEDHKHVVAAFEPYDQNTVLLCSLGKLFNLNGLETGFIVTKTPKIMEKIRKMGEKFDIGADFGNVFSEIATKTAYSPEGRTWLGHVREYVYGNYLMMLEFLSRNLKEIVPVQLQGGYILFCEFEGLGVTEEEFIKRSEEENIFVVAGSRFHTKAKMVRINIACSRVVLRGALERWRTIFKGNTQ